MELLREVHICGVFEACLASQYGDVLKETLMPRLQEEVNAQKRDREYRCMTVPKHACHTRPADNHTNCLSIYKCHHSICPRCLEFLRHFCIHGRLSPEMCAKIVLCRALYLMRMPIPSIRSMHIHYNPGDIFLCALDFITYSRQLLSFLT